jgi:uncharacterized membrane protein YcaP (DUF421 family)
MYGPEALAKYVLGTEEHMSVPQLCIRGVLVFFIAYLLIRLSGRRSFGLRSPLDNITVILLGSILSRAVVGTVPFGHVILAAAIVALLHRLCGRLLWYQPRLARKVEGKNVLLYENGHFLENNMHSMEVSRDDIMLNIRKTLHREDFHGVSKIFIERNGEMSIILEEKPPGS